MHLVLLRERQPPARELDVALRVDGERARRDGDLAGLAGQLVFWCGQASFFLVPRKRGYVNDNFGHRSGDQLIVGVSGVLKEAAKQFNGQVFRLGGDEYAVHLPDSLRGHAMKVAEHLLDALRQPLEQGRIRVARAPRVSGASATLESVVARRRRDGPAGMNART